MCTPLMLQSEYRPAPPLARSSPHPVFFGDFSPRPGWAIFGLLPRVVPGRLYLSSNIETKDRWRTSHVGVGLRQAVCLSRQLVLPFFFRECPLLPASSARAGVVFPIFTFRCFMSPATPLSFLWVPFNIFESSCPVTRVPSSLVDPCLSWVLSEFFPGNSIRARFWNWLRLSRQSRSLRHPEKSGSGSHFLFGRFGFQGFSHLLSSAKTNVLFLENGPPILMSFCPSLHFRPFPVQEFCSVSRLFLWFPPLLLNTPLLPKRGGHFFLVATRLFPPPWD